MRLIPELPLLRRELTELSNRRRTYFVRVLGAVVLLFFTFLAYEAAMTERMGRLKLGALGIENFLGIGGDVFYRITPILFYTIQLLMPALCCASITEEKENNTIGTLLLTKLSPGTIVLEKFGSRLVPMLTLLLLTFPVLAHVHSLGGVDTDQLIGTLWLLFCECLLIASIAILCSAWFATTVSAFIWSYAIIAVLLILTLSLDFDTLLPSAIWREATSGQTGDPESVITRAVWFLLIGIASLVSPDVGTQTAWIRIIVSTLPALAVTAITLLLARILIVRRAFVSQSSLLLRAFKVIDAFFKALNDRTTGGIEVIKDSNPLPGIDPVAWRERNKKSLGKARYLLRILVFLEVPTLFTCMLAATISARVAFEGLYTLQGLIWILAVLVAGVKGATLFSSERARETLEPLLATPMTALEMVRQKVAGMRRLLIVLAIPLLTVNFTHFLLHINLDTILAVRPWTYLLLSIVGTMVLLSLVTWVSAGIGLVFHSQTKAVLGALGLILAWILIPLIAAGALQLTTPARELIVTCSPYSVVEANERFLLGDALYQQPRQASQSINQVWWVFTIPLYAIIVLTIWTAVSALAPRLLNRLESRPSSASTVSVRRAQLSALEGSS